MKKSLLLVVLGMFIGLAQLMAQRTVSGVVTDQETGEPLIGASVLVKGTTTGTITDLDGRFALRIETEDAVLIFSFVGFATQEIPVGDQTVINISLGQGLELQELVVVGYGQQKREQVTGSVSQVDAKELAELPIASFDQALQGKTPGILILGGSGQPGAAAGRVQIRGQNSISGGTSPIYIVDGVPLVYQGNFAALNTRDFEVLSVIKDASAGALYGTRGGSGVIYVQTKSGTPGRTNINYNGYMGITTPTSDRFSMMNTAEKLGLENYLASQGISSGLGGQFGPDGTNPNPAEWAELQMRDINYKDEIIQTGLVNSHELSFDGGNENTTFYISGNYYKEEGQIDESEVNRGSVRMNLSHKVNDFTFDVRSIVSYRVSKFIEAEGAVNTNNPFASAYLINPYESLFNEDGSYNINFVFSPVRNPLEAIETRSNELSELRTFGSFKASYEIIDGLNLSNLIGMDMSNRTSERFIDPNSDIGDEVQGGQGSVARGNSQDFGFINTTLLEFNRTFGERHNLDLLGGFEYFKQRSEVFNFTGYGINPKIPNDAGITQGTGTNGFIPVVGGSRPLLNTLFGGLLRGSYTLDGKYTVSASFRRDGSSRFGEDNRFANFWSVGAAYYLSREDFLKNSNVISDLRLTLSYGSLGNQEVPQGDFGSIGTFTSGGAYNGQNGIVPARPQYPNLKWETLNTFNLGLDFGFADDRLYGTVNFYNNVTKDLFVSQNLSAVTGFGSLQINAGKVLNRGVEVIIEAELLRKDDYFISVYGNFTNNHNEVTDLGQVDEFELGTSIVKEGLPLGTHNEVGWAGVDPATGQPLYLDSLGNVTTVYSSENAVPNWGTFDAPRFGGFGMYIFLKGFSIDVDAVYQQGNQLYNNITFFNENHGFGAANQSVVMNTIWREPGQLTEIQSPLYPRQFSSKNIEDGAYLRIRRLTVAYQLPDKILGKIQGVRIYASASNLVTFTNFKAFDPETSNNIEQFSFPASRNFIFGVNLAL